MCAKRQVPLLFEDIAANPMNVDYTSRGWEPVYSASAQSRIILVGQAPGRIAQETRIPWNDVSGRLLRTWLSVSDDEFYNPELFALMPMDFYYPGKGKHGDLPPRKDFASLWHPRLRALMPHAQLTILVGAYAQKYYLDGVSAPRLRSSLTETVAHAEDYLPGFVPLVHPSPLNIGWRKRNPWFEVENIPDLRERVRKILGT